jgi:hypothetical protein
VPVLVCFVGAAAAAAPTKHAYVLLGWKGLIAGLFDSHVRGGTTVTTILRKLQDNADVYLTNLCVSRCVSSGLDAQHSIHSILIAEIIAFPSIGVLTMQHMISSWKK